MLRHCSEIFLHKCLLFLQAVRMRSWDTCWRSCLRQNTSAWRSLRTRTQWKCVERWRYHTLLNLDSFKRHSRERGREREMSYLTTHSTHFIYGYMASDIWLRTILIVRKETRCRHIGYSYRLTTRVLLYAPSHRQDNTYHGLCYTSRGALAETRNSSMGPPHEGSIRRPTAPWANTLPMSYVLLPNGIVSQMYKTLIIEILIVNKKLHYKPRYCIT